MDTSTILQQDLHLCTGEIRSGFTSARFDFDDFDQSEVAFALPVECLHIAITCPYKERAGRFCMQVQVHEKASSI